MEDKLEIGRLFDSMREALGRSRSAVGIYLVAVTTFGALLDTYLAESSGYFLLSTVVTLVADYLLLRAIVLGNDLADDGTTAGFGSYFGLSFLQGLAVVIGLIFLVVPGVILIVRWTPSFALLMSEKCSVEEAMRRSWGATRGNFWALFGAALLGIVLFGGGVVAFVASSEALYFGGSSLLLEAVATNLLFAAMSAYFALLGVAAYLQLFGHRREIVEVFA